MDRKLHNKKEPIIDNKNTLSHPTRTIDPPISIVEQAKEIEKAEEYIKIKVQHRLDFILKQIKNLQNEARRVISCADQDMELHEVVCNFQKIPGEILYLYENQKKELYFSRLSPSDWENRPPHTYKGTFRMNPDKSYESIEEIL